MQARIVAAGPEHLDGVAAIYADAARTSVSTFDLDGPPIGYWQDKLTSTGHGDHFLVAVASSVAVPADGCSADHSAAAPAAVGAIAPTDAVVAGPETAGAVLGFAYSGSFRPRPAYSGTRETSIYLHRDARGRGVGRQLYGELLDRLRGDGIHLAVAVVAQPNPASVALHEALGFQVVGTFTEIGAKFGRYVDTRWYQLPLH